jgi:hypothetical protein
MITKIDLIPKKYTIVSFYFNVQYIYIKKGIGGVMCVHLKCGRSWVWAPVTSNQRLKLVFAASFSMQH